MMYRIVITLAIVAALLGAVFLTSTGESQNAPATAPASSDDSALRGLKIE